MMRTKYRLFSILIILSLFASSCDKISQINVGIVTDFKINGFEENSLLIGVQLPVENPSGRNIRVTGMDARISINNNYLGKISSIDSILIPRKSSGIYNVVLHVRIANPFGAALTVMNFHSGQIISVKIEGEIMAKSGVLRKKFLFNKEQNVVI